MIYVISDIHGCYDEFMQLLKKANFSQEDTLIINGDIIDRGTQNLKVIEFIMSNSNVLHLMGNHEYTMLDWYRLHELDDKMWLKHGGELSYSEVKDLPQEKLDSILDYLESVKYHHTIELNGKKYVIAHAYTLDLDNKDIITFGIPEIRQRMIDNTEFVSIVGHTPTYKLGSPGVIVKEGNLINIDCGFVYGYNLGMLRLDDMQEFYL